MHRRIPAHLDEIPADYLGPARNQGRVETLTYNTFDTFDYARGDHPLQKQALVYLPHGYDPARQYNIFYLMHGGWGDERTYLGPDEPGPKQPFRSYGFKNILDHAIKDGKIAPLIVVCPTYNNYSSDDSGDYQLAIRLTALYPQELRNDLIPAVESRYSTYAKDVTAEGLRESRDHRGFGGFSMGSVTTWHVFNNCLDYFRYFIAMSGNCGDGRVQDAAVKKSGLGKHDFFLFTATGSEDFAHPAFKRQVMNLGERYTDSFQFADTQAGGNLSYRELPGADHDYKYANQYIYNGLQFFWS